MLYCISVCVSASKADVVPRKYCQSLLNSLRMLFSVFTQLMRLPCHALPPNAMAVAYRIRCTETQMTVHVVFVYMETFLSSRAQCYYGCYTWEDCSEHQMRMPAFKIFVFTITRPSAAHHGASGRRFIVCCIISMARCFSNPNLRLLALHLAVQSVLILTDQRLDAEFSRTMLYIIKKLINYYNVHARQLKHASCCF